MFIPPSRNGVGIAALFWALLAAGCGPDENPPNDTPEICDTMVDEDGDGAIGCEDSDCWTASSGCAEVCTGGNDEDGDGAIDCEDSDCWTTSSGCAEVCSGGNDEDGDGDIDCLDADCASLPICTGAPTYTNDVQPILQAKCASCHTTGGSGGVNFATNYADTQKNASSCAGKFVYECILIRVQDSSMPRNVGCTGDPTTDAGNAGCLTQAEQTTLADWITAGAPQ